ncbi:DUF1565 domain-containing protein [Massilia niastensis]|uniref:DUF1565 domain-containing protein n=1 Tax=Massilia niastensis TaxID=544911 RepID=UPI00037FABF0|nr:right-handed parallel beta-helix repeat-containing protein [Massilia niastensis]
MPRTLPPSRPGLPWLLPWLLSLLLFGASLPGCGLRDGGGENLVAPELVRTHLYVAPGGSDSSPGTRAEPFRTLGRAAQVASAGTTVHVAPGSYSGGVRTTAHGTAEARIVFQSTERWGARIVPPLDARQNAAWDNRGDHVDIIGFEIDGSQYQSGMKWLNGIYNGGSHNGVLHNRIHHIGTDVPCENKGGSGIGIDSYYKGVDAEVTGNQVYDIGPPGCRYMHGIYVNTNATVRNNIVYRVSGAAIHLWRDASHVTVQGNTVANSGTGIVVGAGEYFHSKGPNDHTHVSNNIVFDNGHGILERGATGPNNSFRHNLVVQNVHGDWKLADGRHHSGTVSAAPLFVDYSRDGNPDFHLRRGSPAIGQGLAPETVGAGGAGSATAGLQLAPRKTDIGALPFAEP